MSSFLKSYLENIRQRKLTVLALILLLILAVVFSICYGTVMISPMDIIDAVKGVNTLDTNILINVRIPRTIAAFAVGSSLSVAGFIIQSVLNNPLAGPNILGINTGAGMGFILSSIIIPDFAGSNYICSFIGAVITTYIVLYISRRLGDSRRAIILTGVAVNSIFNAVIDGISQWYPDKLGVHQSFKIGSFAGITMQKLCIPIVFMAVVIIIIRMCYIQLETLKLGDDIAESLGLKVKLWKTVLILISAVLIGLSVSICGILSFVGLIVPHLTKGILGDAGSLTVPGCILIGGGFTILCDFLSRILFNPYDIPVGIIISAFGGVFFLILLFKSRRRIYD